MSDSKNEPTMCSGPRLDVRPPKLKLPPKSADCHCHVFGPRDQYPWAADRLYTPPPVLLDDYLAMLRATGFERGVMVQTGLYGSDNRFIVDAVKAHPKQLRAIALISEDITDRELRDLTDGGVRGFRVNHTAKNGLSFEVARRLAERVKDLGWREFLNHHTSGVTPQRRWRHGRRAIPSARARAPAATRAPPRRPRRPGWPAPD